MLGFPPMIIECTMTSALVNHSPIRTDRIKPIEIRGVYSKGVLATEAPACHGGFLLFLEVERSNPISKKEKILHKVSSM